ncbi:hypothetical protein [Nocardia amamiensis]|uniref:hypothetical protein n=1 Tax=Nocardia amamiensis TaxID=404578 RepID=UPI00082DBCEB|nr:hypothetical protein [Nocardia amamiensis]
MTHAHMDRRVTGLETRVRDVEESYGASIYELTRHATKADIVHAQLIDGVNQLGQGLALMMERLGIPPLEFSNLTMPTEDDIDAALETER